MQAHLHTLLTTKTTYTKALEMGKAGLCTPLGRGATRGRAVPHKACACARQPGAHVCLVY